MRHIECCGRAFAIEAEDGENEKERLYLHRVKHHGCESCQDEPATQLVSASHYDPDLDDKGFVIGWGKPREYRLCFRCADNWGSDILIGLRWMEDL